MVRAVASCSHEQAVVVDDKRPRDVESVESLFSIEDLVWNLFGVQALLDHGPQIDLLSRVGVVDNRDRLLVHEFARLHRLELVLELELELSLGGFRVVKPLKI